ncbi:MAG: McrC family protein [Cyclobacteriaceae bacterium]
MKHLPLKFFRLYEHEALRVGDIQQGEVFDREAWETLLKFYENQYPPLFSIIHQGIRANQQVGYIALPGISLEVLPKTEQAQTGKNQHLLLDMLKFCGRLPKASHSALLSAEEGVLSDFMMRQFADEVEKLLKQGLRPRYRQEEANRSRFSGRLMLREQVRKNFAHKERIFSQTQVLDAQHILHQYIGSALQLSAQLTSDADLQHKTRRLTQHFPSSLSVAVRKPVLKREEAHYAHCLDWAQWLLEKMRPANVAGNQSGISFMTDMQQLFEEYVAIHLQKASVAYGCQVSLQSSRQFWGRRSIRPDIILKKPDGSHIIIDTKWKLLNNAEPSDADLKQMYIYNRFFDAQRGILLYPAQHGLQHYGQHYQQDRGKKLHCELMFARLLDPMTGKLNLSLGDELMEMILAGEKA